MIAIATPDRGPEALGKVHQTLGRLAAFGAGTAIRVFWQRRHLGNGGGCLALHTIHTIAISKIGLRRRLG
ncbi:MAG TPA: hypothetical protein VE871_06325 [Longimicrobium sp.]|nr:hypothetical protein [Longimicrobium sp.]